MERKRATNNGLLVQKARRQQGSTTQGPAITSILTCNRSEQERNRLKEGEQPVTDDAAAAEGGNAEVLAAVENNDANEGGVIEALLQIGTAV